VAELKHFMEFAERGPRAFAEFVAAGTGEFDSQFEQYVASALQSKGWEVHSQVGVSAFRIDLGVVHPDAPGAYLAGVECDGATYHRSATARDRDKLREQVLRGLGWRILRVWSTDWWLDRETTLGRLDAGLREALEQERAGRSVEAAGEVGGGEEVEGSEAEAATPGADPTLFFDAAYDGESGRLIVGIVEAEGPILDEALARKVARVHGWQRTGVRIVGRVKELASKKFQVTREEAGVFYWPASMVAGQQAPFRYGANRAVDEICDEELVSLAADTLQQGRTGEAAVAAMAKETGMQRIRALSRARLERALRVAIDRAEG
jgi:very-short-patch-repair endonuclease